MICRCLHPPLSLTIVNRSQPGIRTVVKTLNDQRYFHAHEAAQTAGISKATLLRWIDRRLVRDAAKRDRNGWRLFSEPEVQAIRSFAQSER